MTVIRELRPSPPLPLYALRAVELLAPGNRVLLRGHYFRISAIVQEGDTITVDLQDVGRRRYRVGRVLPCEVRR